jgi:hypothetical protein
MEGPVRKAIAVALTLTVQGAALTGPLAHAHPDDHATEHHEGRAVHTHWAAHAPVAHPAGAPAVGTADLDRAVFLNAFVAVAGSLIPAPSASQDVFEVPVPPEGVAHRGVEVVRSHDPPPFGTVPSRAPPARLS